LKIAVAGLWHLGTVTAACLASAGHNIIAHDDSVEVVAALRRGRPPVAEPGLAELSSVAAAQHQLVYTNDLNDLRNAEVLWVCYDTPVDDNDNADVEFVRVRVKEILPHLRDGAIVLISSQVPVGTTRELESEYQRRAGPSQLTFAYIPENLRLGKAIESFTHPDRIVAGVRSSSDRARIAPLLQSITNRIEWMSVESAEMTKHALNAYLATSVSFINEIAVLCERIGADALEVERGLKSDMRIGKGAYLHAGAAFAGGTLARDVRFLLDLSHRQHVSAALLTGVEQSNAAHQDWTRHRLLEVLGAVAGKTVAMLGLTYKPGTNTLRRSSALEICHWLHEQDARVQAFDPAVSELPESLATVIHLAASADAALDGADVAVIATPWPEFAAILPDTAVKKMRTAIVIDPARHLQLTLGADSRIHYAAVGRSNASPAPDGATK